MSLEHDTDSAIAQAIRAAGSQSAFGRLIGKRQSTVREWLKKGEMPGEHVLAIEAATGVSRYELRPDLYPRDRAGEAIPRVTTVDQSTPARQHFTDLERAR